MCHPTTKRVLSFGAWFRTPIIFTDNISSRCTRYLFYDVMFTVPAAEKNRGLMLDRSRLESNLKFRGRAALKWIEVNPIPGWVGKLS